jgi:hypothetical protein
MAMLIRLGTCILFMAKIYLGLLRWVGRKLFDISHPAVYNVELSTSASITRITTSTSPVPSRRLLASIRRRVLLPYTSDLPLVVFREERGFLTLPSQERADLIERSIAR